MDKKYILVMIPSASGKLMPMEIVALVKKEISELTMINEVSKDLVASKTTDDLDSHWFTQWLRNKVEIEILTMKPVNTYAHIS